MDKDSAEYKRVREETAKAFYDAVFPSADWDEPSDYEKQPFYNKADQILSIKGLAILADDQSCKIQRLGSQEYEDTDFPTVYCDVRRTI